MINTNSKSVNDKSTTMLDICKDIYNEIINAEYHHAITLLDAALCMSNDAVIDTTQSSLTIMFDDASLNTYVYITIKYNATKFKAVSFVDNYRELFNFYVNHDMIKNSNIASLYFDLLSKLKNKIKDMKKEGHSE